MMSWDFQRARKLLLFSSKSDKIQGGLYQYEKIASDIFDEDAYTQLAIGTARNVRMFNSTGQKFNLGCDMGGVILYPYINWIIEQAQKLNLNRLYFVMRDGFTLKNLCDILIKNKNTPPFAKANGGFFHVQYPILLTL